MSISFPQNMEGWDILEMFCTIRLRHNNGLFLSSHVNNNRFLTDMTQIFFKMILDKVYFRLIT